MFLLDRRAVVVGLAAASILDLQADSVVGIRAVKPGGLARSDHKSVGL
jgi:hypothetical protein